MDEMTLEFYHMVNYHAKQQQRKKELEREREIERQQIEKNKKKPIWKMSRAERITGIIGCIVTLALLVCVAFAAAIV
jgi:hypothetical protein